MKKHFLRSVILGLFALSAGVAGEAFAAVVGSPAGIDAKCPSCNTKNLTCVGSLCSCTFESSNSTYYCAPPRDRPTTASSTTTR
jgi:hypothetical protein